MRVYLCFVRFKFECKNKFDFCCIISAQNWKFAAKQFLKTFPEDIVVHCEF